MKSASKPQGARTPSIILYCSGRDKGLGKTLKHRKMNHEIRPGTSVVESAADLLQSRCKTRPEDRGEVAGRFLPDGGV